MKTNQDKLQVVIEYAKANGWKANIISYSLHGIESKTYFKTIFSHDFAKAVWKDEKYVQIFSSVWDDSEQPGYMFYLAHMVLEKNPIDYCYQYIKGKK